MPRPRVLLPAALLAAVLTAGCGGSEEPADPVANVASGARDEVRAAQQVDPASFPQPGTRSLEDLAADFDTQGPQAVAASSVFRPGDNKLAFGLLENGREFVYGSTVVYLQREGGDRVEGPFAAPADVLVTKARYRSKQAATEDDPFAAVYIAELELPTAGIWRVLAVSDLGGGRRIAAPFAIQAVSKAKDKVPDVGERAPKVATDTLASLKGDKDLLDTRVPPAPDLHEESLDDVLGRKPVALLFATPALCQSRVCGPVVDEMLQLKSEYGDRIAFIHQEVYAGNDPNQGLREPMQRFNLPSEPWLFTIRRDGTIAARAEGSFGLRTFEDALRAAL